MTTQANPAKAGPPAVPRPAAATAATGSSRLIAIVRTARPRQWPKNLLVFAAPLAGATLGPRPHGFLYGLVAMFAFTAASAAVYFVNDVADVERDRQHPVKRNRAIACGDLPEGQALLIAGLLVLVALIAGFAIATPLLSAALAGYMSVSFLYSAALKHIPYVEVAFVASGFLLRVLAGAAATRIPVSGWFLLVCSLGALGVAVAKRYTELVTLGEAALRTRPVMRAYRPERLRMAQYAIGAVTLLCYLLWAAGEHSHARLWHVASAIPLAAALLRFGVLTGRGTTRPVEDLISRDGVMLACEIGWLSLFAAGLYVAY